MYKLQLWEPLIGWVHCVRSSLTAEDNCCFLYTFPSGSLRLLPCSDVYGGSSWLQNCWINFHHWNFHAIFFLAGSPQRVCSWLLNITILVWPNLCCLFFHHGSWPTSYDVVMLKIPFFAHRHSTIWQQSRSVGLEFVSPRFTFLFAQPLQALKSWSMTKQASFSFGFNNAKVFHMQ